MDRLESLVAVEAEIWRQLALCVQDKTHPWRTPVLATVDGERADARTVVLREVDPRQKQMLIYTDERAGKVSQLLQRPHGMLVMWSPELSWQLRCSVRLALEMSGLAASSRWARIRLSPAAQDYLSPLPPGTPLQSAAPTHPAVARDYFAVIDATAESLDWLELRSDGQRRAIFDAHGARWVQP
ncbi:pyridoxamine 5'-phosphate oxidase family protein [uncultured Piscinibacter sp.]|uniref:pyridoxamine 5'-phosphate oxidase family protein n=1 Tax=uncultured Piscinibacter sp. TaxID=1131835 RepID=UPI00262245A0|nr:pyridoxamine 5'-phosphate oxidase family protein [uncultured Piscinibacter sp.]